MSHNTKDGFDSSIVEDGTEELEPFTFSYGFFVALYFIMISLGLLPSTLLAYWFFITFPFSLNVFYLLSLIPLFLLLYGIALISSLISTKIGIWIVHKRITYPKPGTYPISMKDPQARAYFLKGNIRNFGRWLFYFFNLSFLRTFWMRQMGVKIGKHVRVGRYVEDEEFIEIGDNTFMSNATAVGGHLMDRYLTLCETKIGQNCIFDFMSGGVGAIIGDNSIFDQYSGAMKGQICRGNAIYGGMPVKKIGDYSDLSPDERENLKKKILQIDGTDFIKRKNVPIRISEIKLGLMKVLVVIGGTTFGLFFPYLYSLFFQNFYSPSNHLLNITLLLIVPVVFFIALGFFVIGTTLIIKILIVYYNQKAEIPEGYYELDDPRAKYFKIKYFLRLFGLRMFDGTPFKILNTLALRFWGGVRIGKNVKIFDSIIDPQYLEVDDYSLIAQGARVHTHDIIEDKLYIQSVKIGKNVIIGNFSHIKPGVELVDNSVTGVMSWLRKNRKCKRPALWIGKPAVELPLEIIAKSRSSKQKYVD